VEAKTGFLLFLIGYSVALTFAIFVMGGRRSEVTTVVVQDPRENRGSPGCATLLLSVLAAVGLLTALSQCSA